MSKLIEETIKKITTHKGIEGIILSDAEGVPIKNHIISEDDKIYAISTAVSALVKKYKPLISELVGEDLKLIRIKTKVNELMVVPEDDFLLIVIQNPLGSN